MLREKSCGALVYRKRKEKYELLLIKHKSGGHWSFPKGHVESGENELQTALREIKEETGLDVRLMDGFRQSVEYFPKPHVKKQVVYFLASPEADDTVTKQEEEISDYRWCLLDEADGLVTFRNDKNLIREAKRFLTVKKGAVTGSFPVRISRPEPFGRGRKEARFRFLFRFPARIIAVSFAMVILIGTFLLMLPASSRDGSWTPLLDCLFTATSATCVTGLVIYDTYTHWTGFGQCVILLLIQTGGLGLVTMTSFFSMAVGRRLERRNLDLARESIGTQEFTIRPLLRLVVGGALAAEGAGALLLMIALVPQYGAQGIFFSIFTAVSAFCNAGFDLFGGQGLFSSLTNYNGNPLIMGTVSALIIAGGLGFVVYYDLFQYRRTRTLLLHTRVVLAATGILLLSGMLMTLACEWTNPATLGALPNNAQRLGAAWFYSVTCRTAGFNSFPCDLMRGSTKVLSALFMFIGAAPSSTGGGIKCTTAVVLAATVCSVARGDEEVVVFRRRLDHGTVYKSLAVVLMGLSAVAMSAACVMLTDGAAEISGIDAFYESVSAFATVGISVGVTGAASQISRGLLILLMYMGRLGPVSFLLSLAMRREPSSRRVLPEGQIGI